MAKPYTYIFVRTDLSYAQQIVQASHAALEAGFKFDAPTDTSSIVLFGVKDEDELCEVWNKLKANNVKHAEFYEPDISSYTAIATEPLMGSDREHLSEYRTYRPRADWPWWKRIIKR